MMSDNDKLDETLEETFPASDPPANTVETGIRTGEPASLAASVVDNRARNRFELTVDGHTGFLVYQRRPDSLTLVHTEVPDAVRGRHVGDALVEHALRAARAERLQVIAVCPFVRAYLRRHPETR